MKAAAASVDICVCATASREQGLAIEMPTPQPFARTHPSTSKGVHAGRGGNEELCTGSAKEALRG